MSVADYRDRGLPPRGAWRNYLALLGWGPPDGVEVRPIEEIVELYRLEDVNPSPAFFDPKKLLHVNAEYIRLLEPAGLRRAGRVPFLTRRRAGPAGAGARWPPRSSDRVRTLDEVEPMIEFL